MKIVCENCGAKYQIPEEKVQGRVFKFKCNKCDQTIEVDNSSSTDGPGSSSPDWYIVVNDEQVGPISAQQIAAYISEGQFSTAGYVWKEGLPDWVPLNEVEELQYLSNSSSPFDDNTSIASDPASYMTTDDDDQESTAIAGFDLSPLSSSASYDSSGYNNSGFNQQNQSYNDDQDHTSAYSQQGYDPTGYESAGYQGYDQSGYDQSGYDQSGYDQSGYDPSSNGNFEGSSFQPSADEGSFGTFSSASSSSSAESTGGGLFAAFDNQPSSHSNANIPTGLVGQRNESSVLFSLSSLQQVSNQTTPKDNKKGVTEGSGLIDLQALASAHNTLGSGESDDDPFASSSMALPPLAPMGSHKSNTPLIIGTTIGAILLLGLIGAVVFLILNQNKEPQVIAQPQPVQKEVIIREVVRESDSDKKAADEAAKAAAAAKSAAEKNQAEAEEEQEEEDDEQEDSKDSEKKSKKRSRPSSNSRPSRPSSSSRSKPSRKSDGIDALLDKMDNKPKADSNSRGNRGGGGGGGLTKSQVGSTIRKYVPRVISCSKSSNKGNLSGKMFVDFQIRPNGSVTGVKVKNSPFKGTDLARCTEKVVSAMKFPSSNADSNIPVTFPFTI